MTDEAEMPQKSLSVFLILHIFTHHNTWWREVSGSVAQMRVSQGATTLPGTRPSPCPEIRLACYLKPSSVRRGVGGGKPPQWEPNTSHLRTGGQRREERTGEERRGEKRRGSSGTVVLSMALVAKPLHCSWKPGAPLTPQVSIHQTANPVK